MIDVRSASGETTFLRRGPGDAQPRIGWTVTEDTPIGTITDDGTIYYEASAPRPTIARADTSDRWDLGAQDVVALDWTTAGLVGLLIDTGSPNPGSASLARIDLAPGAAHPTKIQDIPGTVDFGLSASGDGVTFAVGTMTDVGSPVRFTLVGPQPTSFSVTGAKPKPIGLWSGSNGTYVFYAVASEASIASRAGDGSAGPSIDLGFPESAFAVSGGGTYAVASSNGVLDSARLCLGSIAPPA
jgi:hypothetical protein